MNELKSIYLKFNQLLAVIIALFAIYVGKDILTKIDTFITNPYLLAFVAKLFVSAVLYSSLFFVGEFLIRNYIWKLFKMKFNFDGEWIGVTYYTKLKVPSPKAPLNRFVPFNKPHHAKITQDCLTIRIASSHGRDYSGFESLSMDITETGELKFAYKVTYEESADDTTGRLTDSALGFEHLAIHKHYGILKKPILITGSFYHCVTNQKPLYSGSTIFIRKDYIEQVAEFDLPGFAQQNFLSTVRGYISDE